MPNVFKVDQYLNTSSILFLSPSSTSAKIDLMTKCDIQKGILIASVALLVVGPKWFSLPGFSGKVFNPWCSFNPVTEGSAKMRFGTRGFLLFLFFDSFDSFDI